MSFDEKISALAEKIPSLIDHLETEEATKNANHAFYRSSWL